MEHQEGYSATEDVHPLSADLDIIPIDEVLNRIQVDNAWAINSIRPALPQVTAVAHAYAAAYEQGGRIFYIGGGTSGRLGFVDAAELPATFGIPADRVQVILPTNIGTTDKEADSREDDMLTGRLAVQERNIDPKDLAIGISAMGETPFVIGAIKEANARGAHTAGITNNAGTTLEGLVNLLIMVPTGPELIAGSTRLKAGTVQKVVLNMISTAAMISLGKVYNGFMVGLRANNEKLRRRALRALTTITGKSTQEAKQVLIAAAYEVDTALVMLSGNLARDKANELLQQNKGNIRETLKALSHPGRR
jgi:N-acetylmuramic acid 6-phosphate etherase